MNNFFKMAKFFLVVLIIVSCAGRNTIERCRPVMGYWRTERDIIITVYSSPEHGVAAFIKSAPGFLGKEIQPGTPVITQIKPLADGSITGRFEMPGEKKAIQVRIVRASPRTLVIMSWDKRVKGNIMKWERVQNPE